MTKKPARLLAVMLLMAALFSFAIYADENENTTKEETQPTIPDFIDVPKDFWGYADIMEMVQMGYLKGKGDGKFDPNGQVTYAEFLTMIANMFYEVETYPNVTNKPWYYDNVRWVKERGIGKYFGSEFGEGQRWYGGMSLNSIDGAEYIQNTKNVMPYYNLPIKRHSMALAMYDLAFNSIGQVRRLPKPEVKLYEHEGARGMLVKEYGWDLWYYNNHNQTHKFVQAAIDYNYKHKFLQGINAKGDFGGHRYMTRAEAAAVLKRLYHASVHREQPTAFKDILIEEHKVNKFGYKSADYDILAVYRPNKLTNGKPDTPENRTELLKEIMLSMPHDKEWADASTFKGMEHAWFNDTIGYGNGGCNGYAAFINTALFGQFAPMRIHNNIYDSKVGDVWLDIDAEGTLEHYDIILEKYQPSEEDKQYLTEEEIKQSSEGVYKTTSGNSGGRVSWGWNDMLAPQALAYQFPKSEIYVLDERTY